MNLSLSKKLFITSLFCISIIFVFTALNQGYIMAAKEVHNFQLSSAFKEATDIRPRDILFTAKHPGIIRIDAAWTPNGKKLTITLYDQENKPLIRKKSKSPLNLVYDYSQKHFEKSKIIGSTFRVEISQSPLRSINGTVEIETPGKDTDKNEYPNIIRGPYGTFIKEQDQAN